MSLFQKHKPMTTTAADLRFVYGSNAAKKIARDFGVAIVTAKLWLVGRTPAARHEEFRQALLGECDRLEARIGQIRKEWGISDGGAGSETGRRSPAESAAAAVARGPTDRDGAPLRRVGE